MRQALKRCIALITVLLMLGSAVCAAEPGILTSEHIRYIEGMGDGCFCPNEALTRAQTA